jgi:hypothetical protein
MVPEPRAPPESAKSHEAIRPSQRSSKQQKQQKKNLGRKRVHCTGYEKREKKGTRYPLPRTRYRTCTCRQSGSAARFPLSCTVSPRAPLVAPTRRPISAANQRAISQ